MTMLAANEGFWHEFFLSSHPGLNLEKITKKGNFIVIGFFNFLVLFEFLGLKPCLNAERGKLQTPKISWNSELIK